MPSLICSSYTIPAWELQTKSKEQFRHLALTALEQRFQAITGLDRISINIRDIMPTDLGLTSWRTPPQLANVYTDWVRHELNSRQLIVIFGIVLLSYHPFVSRMRVSTGLMGCSTLGLHDFEKLQAVLPVISKIRSIQHAIGQKDSFGELENLKMEGYFANPYIWDAESVVHIEVQSTENNEKGDRLVLNGFVAEPRQSEVKLRWGEAAAFGVIVA